MAIVFPPIYYYYCKRNRRVFELAGFDDYWPWMAEGLQVLRYNTTKAYTNHYDYFEEDDSMADHVRMVCSIGVRTRVFLSLTLKFYWIGFWVGWLYPVPVCVCVGKEL